MKRFWFEVGCALAGGLLIVLSVRDLQLLPLGIGIVMWPRFMPPRPPAPPPSERIPMRDLREGGS